MFFSRIGSDLGWTLQFSVMKSPMMRWSQSEKENKKLISYLPIHKNINLKLLVSDIELIIKDLYELSSDRDLNLFWKQIPRIKTDR